MKNFTLSLLLAMGVIFMLNMNNMLANNYVLTIVSCKSLKSHKSQFKTMNNKLF